MLQLIDVKKNYYTAGQTVQALKGVDLCFRKNEFVSILGASGCGKTTMLNIIGGLDHYTSGDLVINGKSTKAYKDHDWDVYRNHRIGFVFQSYNLIPHQTVLGNVEIALTIAGLSKAERRQRAIEALKKVGLEKELHKRPNQLSGGQMQRVAIARALVNNPEILLADEPTGALDTVTSVQIMDLIKEISGERLVIMVTHNPELAEEYSSRIVRLQDGLVISDSNPCTIEELQAEEAADAKAKASEEENLKALAEAEQAAEQSQSDKKPQKTKKEKKERSSMSYATSLGLSARNLATKKGRTTLTSVAGSIGIISVCLVLALSNGFNNYILKTEEDMLSYYPISIEEQSLDVMSIMDGLTNPKDLPDLDKIGDKVYVNSFLTNIAKGMTVKNDISEEYVGYLEDMDEELYTAIQYKYGAELTRNLYTEATLEYPEVEGVAPIPSTTANFSLSSLRQIYTQMLTETPDLQQYSSFVNLVDVLGSVVNKMPGTADVTDKDFGKYVHSQYDVVYGDFPETSNQAVLVVGGNNDVTDITLVQLGLISSEQLFVNLDPNKTEQEDVEIDFSKICEKKYYLCSNDEIYVKNTDPNPSYPYTYRSSYNAVIEGVTENPENISIGKEITISGILRLKDGLSYGCLSSGLNLTEQLVEEYIDANVKTEFSKWVNENPTEALNFMASLKHQYSSPVELQRAVGAVKNITSISIYTENFDTKQGLIDYLEAWNARHTPESGKQIKYDDTVGTMMTMMQTMLDAITYILVAFTSISLVVSSVMIGIITYVSVVERVKEIGVLRSLGARKKDIKNLFNAETFIIGLAAGLIGVGITYLLSIGINALFKHLAGIVGICTLPIGSAITMVVISITLTLISGLIPASAAAKKDPVVALRTE
ncbi:MAG: ABC transporter ATP-binding protein/permease [Clostridia bacterium]|nr:ABC transporter ATP-binding protein/permease [Clostridia bacterium]